MQSLQGLQSGEYKGTKRLKLSCGLTTFPHEILQLSDSLEILDLSGNLLSDLPDSINQLQNLKVAFFSDCNFTTFPKALAQCPSLEMIAFKSNRMTTIPEDSFPPKLRWLILTNNLIANLPSSIGKCHRLQKCMLAGNQLTSLPEEMANCKKLGLLRLSCNKITTLPPWLFTLPELAFLAFAGNPCAPSFAENPTLVDISWEELEVQHLLGEGASGIISKGLWNPMTTGEEVEGNEKAKDVAVKLFKGEVTSDGSPTDEMNACITAGQHTNLISPLGKIKSHPSSSQGLVLRLIPPHYTNLGLPPNLQTCTRDNFPEGTTFTLDTCKSILLGIAEAAAHIHAKGIAHGDLYAHNILIDTMGGHALLGDFGAATIYGSEHEYSEEFERLEVLAFGFLMEDLLGLVERRVGDGGGRNGNEGVFDDEKDGFLMVTLTELCESCTSNVVEERPDFEELCDVLRGL